MILLLESLHPDAEALLAAVGPLTRTEDPNAPPDDLSDVRAILTRGRGLIRAPLLERCPKLEVIARAGAGLDNLDTQTALERGLAVVYAPGVNSDTVAEHTLALMLDLARGVTRCAHQVAGGRWSERARYVGRELRGATLGIIGYGRIGQRVAALATAFGMRVITAEHGREIAGGPASLPMNELLKVADIVTLHVPLTAATRDFIGARELASMKAEALLVNTSRGALIQGPALREAMAAGRLGGFAGDVLDVEPPEPNDPLLRSDRVVLTPHVASLTSETYRELCLVTAENVARVLAGEPADERNLFELTGFRVGSSRRRGAAGGQP